MSKYDGHTPGPWKLIWWGNEEYPYPLSVHSGDDTLWIARDGTVSSHANARLIADAPTLLAQRDEAVALLKKHFGWEGEQFLGREGLRRLHEDTEAFLARIDEEASE